jgi:hypothetical protein
MSATIDHAVEPAGTLEAHCRAAEREAAEALIALSARMFVCPAAHDAVRASEPFRHWRACSDRARLLRERLDAPAAARVPAARSAPLPAP